ncbi:hypothetical protein [Chlamydia psittaci]|uniref:hypothetical protein n=1 Tax=Chlamydia psittaci TaxID=83554 RepID=UPI00027E5357|nr:hypothetical protein [Chlamydia psittaci]AFS28137.1 hypothetical protein B712_0623 [Chlamydia psittaci NJ1]KPZ38314.1 hypothetical protein GWE_01485 [Chlamydia psittaci NJ1]MDS0920148.1 hypothetical protein [Chlamydia psittaci]MDS0989943.1 hypothetical protein [Chlamydia psittaci]MDS0995918.1 hypothetical protein [Chlamydia psittaci]
MRTQNFFLSKIRLLGALCLASLSVLLTGCDVNDVFTTDKSIVQEAKSSAPIFTNTEDAGNIWDTIKSAWSLSEQMDCVPIVIYDDLMNPSIFQSQGLSLWNTAVDVEHTQRIFNYDSRKDKKDPSKNYADLNAIALDLQDSKNKEDVHASAILYGIEKDTFVALCNHYPQHSLVPVIVYKQLNDTTVYSLGFMFSVTNSSLLTPQDVLPEPKRFSEIWQAINSQEVIELYGKQFPSDYINTTVFANGKTINSLIPPANE